jgi:MYXO-CTERM domain-containing protein
MTRRHFVGALAPIVIALTLLGITSLGLAAPPQPAPNQNQARGWLRPTAATRASSSPASSPFTWGKVTASLLLVGLGGYALYRRRRGAKIPGTRQTLGELSVVAATRVGPKSQVVLVRVGTRHLLVGATDSSVNSLGWLEDAPSGHASGEHPRVNPDEELPDESEPRDDESRARSSRPNSLSTPHARSSRFREVLADAIGLGVPTRPEPSRRVSSQLTAAELLAERTTDRFTRTTSAPGTGRRRATVSEVSLLDVEGQARGLVSRLERKVP